MDGRRRRRRVQATDEWEQLKLLCRWPEQLAYEEIRPPTLFGASVAERANETGSAERTLYRRVGRFEEEGMEGLFSRGRARDAAPGHTRGFDGTLANVDPPTRVIPKQPSLRATVTAVVATLVVTTFVFGLLLLLALSVPVVRAGFPTALALSIWVHALLVLAAAAFIARRYRVPPESLGFVRPGRRLLHLLWQIPSVIIVLLVVQGVAFAVRGGTSPSSRSSGLDSLLASAGPATTILGFLGIAILTPLWEETVFRGMIFGTVRARWGTVAAVPFSAAIFAVGHGIPILLPYMITLGLALGLLRAFHRNLWGPLALHTTINSIAAASLLAVVLE